MGELSSPRQGDRLDVEIAGTVIGEATISEITTDYIEVVYVGQAIKLPADVFDYYELFNQEV